MTDILISYARRDHGVAAWLAAQLAERGLKAVWDIAELPEGEVLSASRERQQTAAVIVALWSKESAASQWVADEAESAIGRDALVSASIDGTRGPIDAEHPRADLSAWNSDGAGAALDGLIKAIAEAAKRADVSTRTTQVANSLPAVIPTPAPSTLALVSGGEMNPISPPGEAAAVAVFIIIAFLMLLGVAVARKDARTPAVLPPISMDATEPLDVTVVPPTPDEENAPSGLRPVPPPSQDSTGSVRK